jgi:hypothetical protein
MLRVINLTLTSTPSALTLTDQVDGPNTISIENLDSSEYVYLGDGGVTTSRFGIRLSPGQIWSADLGPYDKIYAIGSGKISVLVLER